MQRGIHINKWTEHNYYISRYADEKSIITDSIEVPQVLDRSLKKKS